MDTDMNAPRYGIGGQSTAGRVEGALFDEGLRRHMLGVYNYMGLGLVVTGLVAIVVGITPSLYVPIFSTPLKWVVILAPLPFAFLFAGRIRSMSATTAQALFWDLLRRHGTFAGIDFPRFYRNKYRKNVLYRRRDVRRHEPLRIHDAS